MTHWRAALAAGVLGGMLASAAYQAAGDARDRRRYSPPGRLVDVGGRRLHVRCAGSGTPAVVLIPAMGDTMMSWLPVQDALAPVTTVCVYDRPGLGWSDPAPGLPTAAAMARDLRGLLDAAGVAPPFVVAGHSLGGLVAQVFSCRYPGEMAGLALVDSSHPGQVGRLPRTHLRDHRGGKLAEAALTYAQPLGLRRAWRDVRRVPRSGDGAAELALSSRYRRACLKELLAFNAICRDAGAAAGGLSALPLTVITSSERDPKLAEDSEAQRARSRFYQHWAKLQSELAALSEDSVHIVAGHAGHHVQRDDPELVAGAIAGLVQRTRKS
jgi:pimeloyl-ACP methyl ester carboxylesterase